MTRMITTLGIYDLARWRPITLLDDAVLPRRRKRAAEPVLRSDRRRAGLRLKRSKNCEKAHESGPFYLTGPVDFY